MKIVNRCAISLVPTAALLAWVNRVDPEDKLKLADVQEDPTLFLVSDLQDEEEMKEFLEDNFEQMFEFALNEWYTDVSVWPSRTFAIFQEYFTAKLFSTLVDIDDDLPLERDEVGAYDEGEEDDENESDEK